MTRFTLTLCSVMLMACSGGATPVAGDGGIPTFIALAGDFDGFEAWQRYDLGHQEAGGVHVAGERSIFLSRAPPHGVEAFPVGTMVVKVVHGQADAGVGDQVFAMAKRGGTFNGDGHAWEWFELDLSATPPVLVWRGALPPERKGYGGGAGGACNGCHSASSNDLVLTPALLLGNF